MITYNNIIKYKALLLCLTLNLEQWKLQRMTIT